MPLDQLIPGTIGLLIFGIPTGYLVWLLLLAIQSRSWKTTPGTIVFSLARRTRAHQARVSVAYRYEIDGTTYTGTTVYFGSFLNASAQDARETAARYRSGATVPVYYHPQRPSLATLETRVAWGLILWIILGCVMVGSIVYGCITGT